MPSGIVVGLDIGSSQMKVAEIKRSGGGIEVTALGVAPTPSEAFENSVIVDPQALGQAVKALLRDSGISAKHCVSSVSGQSGVVVRVIEMPQLSDSELDETVKWEAERHIPFSINDTVMDYQPIERPEGYGEGQNMDVLLAVAQTDMIDRHIEMLQAAGLRPDAIDVEPLAASRALLELQEGEDDPGRTVVIVNMGASVTDIGIYRDKLPTLLRTLPLAGDNITRAIAEALGIEPEVAENYKKEFAEVLVEQLAQPTADFTSGTGFNPNAGFLDFTAPPPPTESTGPSSSGSGRMPFDFSMPADAPPPAPSPFDLAGEDAPSSSLSGSMDPSLANSGSMGVPGSGSLGAESEPAPAQPAAGSTDLSAAGSLSGSLDAQNLSFIVPEPTAPSVESEPGFFSPTSVTPAQPAEWSAPPQEGQLTAPQGESSTPDAVRVRIFNAIAPVLSELVQELRRSLDFHRAKSPDARIDEVLLIGGMARLKNLAPFLEGELGIRTRVADPMENVRLNSKTLTSDEAESISSLVPISIGLGVYNLVGAPSRPRKSKRK